MPLVNSRTALRYGIEQCPFDKVSRGQLGVGATRRPGLIQRAPNPTRRGSEIAREGQLIAEEISINTNGNSQTLSNTNNELG